MKCCRFGFGTCKCAYLYILFSASLYFLKSCILSFSELSVHKKINIFGINPVLLKHGLIKMLIEYLGYFVFGGIFFYRFRIYKIYIKKKKEKKEKKENCNNSNKELIVFKKKYISLRIIKLLLITCSIFSVQSIIRYVLHLLQLWPLDLWIFNIIFITFFMKIILKIEIYRHQLYSLGCNFAINLVLLIVASSIKDENGISHYDMIANNYGHHIYIALFYLVFLALAAMICLSQIMQKKLMDVENESPFTILFIIGILNTIFIIIVLIITTYVKCDDNLVSNNLCSLTLKDPVDNYTYFDSFKIFINNLKIQYNKDKTNFFIEVLVVYPLYSFFSFLKFFCDIMIIYHLNPIYILISDNTYFSIRMIISIINNPSDISNYLKFSGEIISLFTYIFYLEIIEIKCCNMNFNTRMNINERSKIESLGIDDETDDDNEDDISNVNNNNTNEINNNEKEVV